MGDVCKHHNDANKLKHVFNSFEVFLLCVFVGGGGGLSPQTLARQVLHPEFRQSSTGGVVNHAMLPRRLCLKAQNSNQQIEAFHLKLEFG